jgi:hypothetical protein
MHISHFALFGGFGKLDLIFIVCQEPECISFLFSSDDSSNG